MAVNFNNFNIPMEETELVGGFGKKNPTAMAEELNNINTLFETAGLDARNSSDVTKFFRNARLKEKFKNVNIGGYLNESQRLMTEATNQIDNRDSAEIMSVITEENGKKLDQLFENSLNTALLTEAGNTGMNNPYVATQFPLMKQNWVANTYKDFLDTRVTPKPIINRQLMQPYLQDMEGNQYKIPQLFNEASLDGGAALNKVINAGRQYVYNAPVGIGTAAGTSGGIIDLLTLSNGSRSKSSALSMDVCIAAVIFPNPDATTTVSTKTAPTSLSMPLVPIDAGTLSQNQYKGTTQVYGNPDLSSVTGIDYLNEQTATSYTGNAMGWSNDPFSDTASTTVNEGFLKTIPSTSYTLGYEPATVLNGVNTANNTYVTSDGNYLVRRIKLIPDAATATVTETISAMSPKGTMMTDTITFSVNYRDGIVNVASSGLKAIAVVFGGTLSSENNLHTLTTYYETINYTWKIPAGEHLNAALSIEQFEDVNALYDTNLQAVMLNQMALTLAEFKDWKQKTAIDESREEIQNDIRLYNRAVFNGNPGGNYSGTVVQYRHDNLLDTIDNLAIQMKMVFNARECFFAIIGNPKDIKLLGNSIWQYQESSEVLGSSKLTYNFGITNGQSSYVVLSNNKIQPGALKMIIRPRDDQYISYMNLDYTFNIVNNYRNPMEPMLPNLMATQRFLVVDVIPMQSDILITNNPISTTTTYEGPKPIPSNIAGVVNDIMGNGSVMQNAPTAWSSTGLQASAPTTTSTASTSTSSSTSSSSTSTTTTK